MTIETHDGRTQVACDSCPASYPNTYAAEDFAVMIADARTGGWVIRRARAPAGDEGTTGLFGSKPRLARKDGEQPQPYTHACPECATRSNSERRLF